jgi:hypothetical protein
MTIDYSALIVLSFLVGFAVRHACWRAWDKEIRPPPRTVTPADWRRQ